MIPELIIDQHALKHGLTRDEVLQAAKHIDISLPRENGDYVAIGFDSHARAIEMLIRVKGDLAIVFHAMTPPTKKIMKELGFDMRGGATWHRS